MRTGRVLRDARRDRMREHWGGRIAHRYVLSGPAAVAIADFAVVTAAIEQAARHGRGFGHIGGRVLLCAFADAVERRRAVGCGRFVGGAWQLDCGIIVAVAVEQASIQEAFGRADECGSERLQ